MDGWGSLTMLIKRQNSEKYRKANLRYKLQKKKEDLLKELNNNKDEFNFPEISEAELEIIKAEIRKEVKKQRIQDFGKYILLIIIIVSYVLFSIYI